MGKTPNGRMQLSAMTPEHTDRLTDDEYAVRVADDFFCLITSDIYDEISYNISPSIANRVNQAVCKGAAEALVRYFEAQGISAAVTDYEGRVDGVKIINGLKPLSPG